MKVFTSVEELAAAKGTKLEPSEWVEVEQSRIDQFADATDDHQWIHCDPERAAEGPFGKTIGHGFLSLSLLPRFWHQIFEVEGVKMGINYGLNKVRFPSPVPVGSKIRGVVEIADVQLLEGAVQAEYTTTVEIEGSDKPACIAVSLIRYVL